MTRSIFTVRNGTLHEHTKETSSTKTIAVESAAWYAWLESHRSFRFEHPAYSFTARKEQRSGGWYWYAYRHLGGRLRTAYLGKSTELSLIRLNAIAAALVGASDTQIPWMAEDDRMPVPHASPLPLPTNFTTPEPVPKHNLPRQLTSFVGREQDITALAALLRQPTVRLLTLTGTAGVGKTRLGLQVAAELTNAFIDGVCFVSLAPLRDPEFVLPAVAQALKLPEARGRTPLEYLQAALREQHLLLLLDNFEQVAEAAPFLVALLQSCSNLKIIVTSRASLRVRGKYEVRISPLDLPDPSMIVDLETLANNAAVTLFTQRAQALAPDFTVTETNAQTVAEICGRLDGLPLAIELAAAYIKLLSPRQLLSRLEHRLETLTGGAQDLPVRQQTLRSTLQWSYDLLRPAEQWLFRLLSVFVGGCTVEAVEAMCQALQNDVTAVLDGLQRLLDNNLILESKQPDGEMRLMMLETIREYGQERLTRSNEEEAIQRAHAEYYLALAEEAGPLLYSSEQLQWLERLEQEYDNLRAAVNYLLQKEQFELVLRLTGPLWFFWALRAHIKEGQHWVDTALASGSKAASSIRAKAMLTAGATWYFQGQWESAKVLVTESLHIYRQVGDKHGIAVALNKLGQVALREGNLATAQALCEESLPLLKDVEDRRETAEALYISSYGLYAQGDYARARAVCEESLAIAKEVGDRWEIAYALQALGFFAYKQGNYASAQAFYEESLATCKAMRAIWMTASSLAGLGEVAAAQGQFRWAARLWGAIENLYEPLGASRLPIDQAAYESAAATRTQLGEEAFTTLWAEGRTMSLEHVLADQEPIPFSQQDLTTPPLKHAKLTPRELEVLRLLVRGLTSAEIAEKLVVALVTVNTHVRSIYNKLEVNSRSAVTRYAIEHHLV